MQSKQPLELTRHDGIVFASFGGYACCTIVLPLVLAALAQDLDFSLEAGNKGMGGFLQMGISIFMVLSMLGCGFMAGLTAAFLMVPASYLLMLTGVASQRPDEK